MADEKQFLDKDGLEHIIDTQIGKTDISGIGNGTIKGAISTVKDSLTNPNLIDNGWFNVNSRGLSAYGGQVYSVDRWKILDGSKTATYLTINDDGSITLQNTTSGNVYIGQDTEFQGISFNSYKLSVLDNENVIHASSSTSGINLDDGKCYFYLENKRVSIRLLADCNVTIKAIKLEKGSISTLANDTAPDYQTELLKCQTSTADSTDTYANKSLFQPISDAWLSTKAYAVGDYAIHNNLLWKCLVANTGTTPVEGANWTATSVSKELGSILKIKYFDSLISSQEGYVSSTPVDCQYILSVTNVNANASSNYMLATRVEKDDNNLPTVKYRQSNSGNTQYRFLYI